MAKETGATFSTEGWKGGFTALRGPAKESLARRMLVSGAIVMRDEARANALISQAKSEWNYNEKSRGSQVAGNLSENIYYAFDTRGSTTTRFTYKVSWAEKKTFWGKFLEFGYYRRYVIIKNEETGTYSTLKKLPLDKPVWVPARPFLAPAYDSSLDRAKAAMIARGQKEFPILMRESNV